MARFMSYEAQSHDAHQLELLMATIFTCRSVVRYGLILGEEQKKELLADIDTSLEALRSYMLNDPSTHPKTASSQTQPPNFSPVLSQPEEASTSSGMLANNDEQQILQALYRMYHTYMSANQDKNLSTFVSRFNDAMATVQEIQRIVERDYQANDRYTRASSVEEPFRRVKVFMADLYYIFLEFMRVLSEILQKNNVQLNTEELCSLQGEQAVDEKALSQYNLVSLFGVYEAHQRLNQNREVIAARITDATAFLEFLKESLATDLNRRDEFLSQLNNITRLLHELSCLVAGF
jgi:hypothetical protein